MTNLRPPGPPVNLDHERWTRRVYAAAMQRLFGAPTMESAVKANVDGAFAAVSVQLVVAWSGLGPRVLRERCERSLDATGRQIAREVKR